MKRWMLVLALVASGCGGENTQDASMPALPPDPPSIPDVEDFGDDDFLEDVEPLSDTLDAPEADTLAAEIPAPAPTFEPFLRDFKVALQNGEASRFAAPSLSPEDLATIADDPAVQQQVLAAGAEQYRREGTRREVYVVVGYDAEGNVVREDEAVTESGVGLVFDVVGGQYRLIQIERAG